MQRIFIGTIVIFMSAMVHSPVLADEPGYLILQRAEPTRTSVLGLSRFAAAGQSPFLVSDENQLIDFDPKHSWETLDDRAWSEPTIGPPPFVPCFGCNSTRRPMANHDGAFTHSPKILELRKRPYSYGWFGVAPSQAGTRRTNGGYHGSSTRMTFE